MVISAIATVILVINAIISPETSSLPAIISSGVVPIVLCISLLSPKKNDDDKKQNDSKKK